MVSATVTVDDNVAAVDCGTNSTRLLVADRSGRTLARQTRITRLGQGVGSTGRLGEEAIERTASALAAYRVVMDKLDVGQARLVATSAARDAMNYGQFVEVVQRTTGLAVEILGGEEEGSLAFAGATSDLVDANGPFLVLDIGGGSTEMVVGCDRPSGVVSLDMGCVRLTERFLLHDPPTRLEIDNAAREVSSQLDVVSSKLHLGAFGEGALTLVGLAGTVSTLAALHQGLVTYDRDRVHHSVLTLDMVARLFGELLSEDLVSRRARPGMDPGRADVIIGGTTILVGAMRKLGFSECLVSEADILDGLVFSILGG